MDELLLQLREVSLILLPTVGLICVILLAYFLYHLGKTAKHLKQTLNQVDAILDSSKEKIDQLQEPLDTLKSVSNTVDVVNDSAFGMISSAISITNKYSDSIVAWSKDMLEKKQAKKDHKSGNDTEKATNKEEDFGIYE